jgi:hypothetical protein
MKIKIRPYLIALIKENIAFIGGLALALFFIIFILITMITKIFNNNERIKALKEEIENLKKKQLVIRTQIDEKKLEDYIKFLDTLIPQQEDYFSIIAALEKISQTTGFIITSYQVNLSGHQPGMTKITVIGQGNKDTFFNFLKNYNFDSGRLITAEDITLSEVSQNASQLQLTFYNQGNKKLTSTALLSQHDLNNLPAYLSKIEKILGKTSFSLKEEEQQNAKEAEPASYQKKTNPF